MTPPLLPRAGGLLAGLCLFSFASQIDAQVLGFTIPGFAASRYTSLGADLPDRQFIMGSPSNQTVYIHEQSANNSYALSAGLPQDFGYSVDLLDPSAAPAAPAIRLNTLAVVGCPGYQQGLPPRAGRVVVFALRNRQIIQSWSLTPSQPRAFGEFGFSVAITHRNQQPVLLIGEPGGGANAAGRAHVLVYDSQAQAWVGEQTLSPISTARSGDAFGWSVAVHGDRAVVGAPLGGFSGYADLYEFDSQTWNADRRFTAGGTGADCGFSVAVSPDHTAVGSPAWDGGQGRFDLLAHQGTTAPVLTVRGDEMGQLGYSVDVREVGSLTRVLVGKPEARDSGALELHERLPNGRTVRLADWQIPTLPTNARLGAAVVLSQRRALGLAPQVDSPILGPGTVFDYFLPSRFGEAYLNSNPYGLAGGLGVEPQIFTTGQLEEWHRLTIDIANANPNSPAVLAIGSLSPTPLPILGGLAAVTPSITLPFPVDPFGQARFDIPALPRGFTSLFVAMQAYVADAGAPEGVAFSEVVQQSAPFGY